MFYTRRGRFYFRCIGKSELPFQIKVFLNLSIFSGCRRGELLGAYMAGH